MEKLEVKKINGHKYYYYSIWQRVNGKPRRIRQKYLGKLDNIVKALDGGEAPDYAEIFQLGLPLALWAQTTHVKIIEMVDSVCCKRDQGLTLGVYIAIAAINRAMKATSKNLMWEWFQDTVLMKIIPNVNKDNLSSQSFWNHMNLISEEDIKNIWKNILTNLIRRGEIDLSSVCYDGTNYYTFIDSFNSRSEISKRGKNKQGRKDLRQVNYALFCSADHQIPLYFDAYEGNRHDAKQFPVMVQEFHKFYKEAFKKDQAPDTTLIFDKGNNSLENIQLIDDLQMNFIGSIKLIEAKELAETPNNNSKFIPCQKESLEGAKYFKKKLKIYGKERTMIVVFNQNLWDSQWKTTQSEIAKAQDELDQYKRSLDDRLKGIVKKGRKPTVASAEKKSAEILKRPYLKKIIQVKIEKGKEGLPKLSYKLDTNALHKYANTYLGKNIIITSRDNWEAEKVIEGYRSQYLIEDIFKSSKDRERGCWWPMYHYTTSKIKVHALYCTLALLIRSTLLRDVTKGGINISMKRLLTELDGIREVVNVFEAKGQKKLDSRQSVLSKLSSVQFELMSILSLSKDELPVLG